MTYLGFLALAVLLLAYTNGANDNFKGVATLYGSGTLGYRSAIGIGAVNGRARWRTVAEILLAWIVTLPLAAALAAIIALIY